MDYKTITKSIQSLKEIIQKQEEELTQLKKMTLHYKYTLRIDTSSPSASLSLRLNDGEKIIPTSIVSGLRYVQVEFNHKLLLTPTDLSIFSAGALLSSASITAWDYVQVDHTKKMHKIEIISKNKLGLIRLQVRDQIINPHVERQTSKHHSGGIVSFQGPVDLEAEEIKVSEKGIWDTEFGNLQGVWNLLSDD